MNSSDNFNGFTLLGRNCDTVDHGSTRIQIWFNSDPYLYVTIVPDTTDTSGWYLLINQQA